MVATIINVQLKRKRSAREVVFRVLDVALFAALDGAMLDEDEEDKRNLKTVEMKNENAAFSLIYTKGNAAFIVAERARAVK